MHAFVLAGGNSSRMGRDKATLVVAGQPLIVHALEKLRALDFAPRICGSRPDLAEYAEVVPDNSPGCGPLAGIEAALSVSDSDLNLFLPVDLPSLPIEFLRWIVARAAASSSVATIPQVAGRPEPLCAVYSRRLLPGLRESLARGDFKIMAAIPLAAAALGSAIDEFPVESLAAAMVSPSGSLTLTPGDWFRNVNTPDDYDQVRRSLETNASGANERHPIS